MNTYIFLLRGINVGGNRIIKMDHLKAWFKQLGAVNASSFIQSGNIIYIIYQAKKAIPLKVIVDKIEKETGFLVPVIQLTLAAFETIILSNPYLKQKKDAAFFHVFFLSAFPDPNKMDIVKKKIEATDVFEIKGNALYQYCPNGYSQSKLTNSLIDKSLGLISTTRNWKTCLSILEMAKSI
jgi:uncharacterized protein (DUF1697 family)